VAGGAHPIRPTGGGAGDQGVLSALDPGAVGQDGELFFVQPALGGAVDVRQAGLVAQLAELKVHVHALARAVLLLGVGEPGDELVGVRLLVDGQAQHGLVGVNHAVEPHLSEQVEGSVLHVYRF
jgi:hypothetical protein